MLTKDHCNIFTTGHPINETISDILAKGTGYPRRHTSTLSNMPEGALKALAPPIAYGILRGTADAFAIAQEYDKDWWMVDKGYMRAKHYSGYYRISHRGLQATYNEDVASRLNKERFDALKIDIKPWNSDPDGHILLCPPSRHIEQYYGFGEDEWTRYMKKTLSNVCDRMVKVRRKEEATYPLANDLIGAYALITHNSMAGVDALIEGIPVISGPGSTIHGWNKKSVLDINHDLTNFDRDKLFTFLSWCQFTLAEFESGDAFKLTTQIQGCKGKYYE